MDKTNTNTAPTYISSDPLRLSPADPNNPPKRKRTKLVRNTTAATTSHQQPVSSNPKPARKPDPSAPKITRPCTECGRSFWSWKALFGHMRCHPERQWRGIVPPPNLRRHDIDSSVTDDDHEVAAYLLMLANGPPLPCAPAASDNYTTTTCTVNQGTFEHYDDRNYNEVINCGRFECSSCKKVFGSHQALGGHRASHKNVKGCYAITKNVDGDGGEEVEGCCFSVDNNQMYFKEDNNNNNNNNGHKCSICLRVFTSGQALGGHMRCHWEKVVVEPCSSRVFDFDLNLAAPFQDADDLDDDDDDDDDTCFAGSSGPALNLTLGL